ncbi:MAG: TIR domain-containing protein [Cyclobacteriaceae bacterium]|nr:TIR domain-containing protein [Cyclobacteriaceae bacterium]
MQCINSDVAGNFIRTMTPTPKIFISYSWTTPNHEDWVINLAERLVSDGVDVVIDKWDLKEGHDKYTFMESMVRSIEIVKVLIVLDKKYTEKANSKTGGVGTETQIISPKIYENVSQEKFIPIVTERDENGNPYMPTYLESRIYIDFSSQEHFEINYEALLRNIFKRPSFNKPKLGKAPSYLFEETPMTHKTTTLVRSFDEQVSKNPKRINSMLRDFLDKFFSNLKDFTVTFPSRDSFEIGKAICDNINLYTPLRNDFIDFFDKLTKEDEAFDIDIVIRFLEKLPILTMPQDDRGSWSNYEFDNFRFFIHELFLSLIAISIKNEKYKFIEEILYSSYMFQDKYGSSEDKNYGKFYLNIESINPYYNQTYSRNFFSPMAELMIKRVPENLTLDNIVEADLLCHYVGVLNSIRWFPMTYIYKTRGTFELFERLQSMRHFEKTKMLYSVSTTDELRAKLTEIKNNDTDSGRWRYSGAFESVRPIYTMIKLDKIGTTR